MFCCAILPSNNITCDAGRLTNNERKATITEELLADPELSQVRKRRFNKLQVTPSITVNSSQKVLMHGANDAAAKLALCAQNSRVQLMKSA